jgi:hypothetical protein
MIRFRLWLSKHFMHWGIGILPESELKDWIKYSLTLASTLATMGLEDKDVQVTVNILEPNMAEGEQQEEVVAFH